jgi:Na+/proline symporter
MSLGFSIVVGVQRFVNFAHGELLMLGMYAMYFLSLFAVGVDPILLIPVIAVIFLAAWGSIAAALNSLASCTVVDFHKKFINKNCTEAQDYSISKWYTFGWGVFSVIVAMFAYNLGNSLIEAVNILGSLFYGVILGIFLVAFWIKFVKGNAVFIASVISELLIILIYNLNVVSFLWLNVIGAILVIFFSVLMQLVLPSKKEIET